MDTKFGQAPRKKLADISNLPQQIGQAPRKKLADISNLPQQIRPSSQDKKRQHIPATFQDYIEKLHKENLVLMRMLAERNNIIERTGVEIEKLRTNIQKMQQQNQQLAQANSQMFAELNSNKDRLKTLQHELGCKNGLLKAIKSEDPCKNALLKANKSETEEPQKTEVCRQLTDEVKSMKCEEAGDPSLGKEYDEPPRNLKRRLQPKSLDSSKQVKSEDKAENKRSCVRRRSVRFILEELKPNEDSFEVHDRYSPCSSTNDSVQETGSTSTCISSNDRERASSRTEPVQLGRSSLSRPLREATKKVQSYKEIPVNIKMRRPQ